jgi:hypothetical protein
MPSFFHLKLVAAPEPGTARTVIDVEVPGTTTMAGRDSTLASKRSTTWASEPMQVVSGYFGPE